MADRTEDLAAAAKDRGILVCGTEGAKHPTAELAIGLMIDLARHISEENARMKAGEAWQATVGADLFGHTLGIVGLGRAAEICRLEMAEESARLAGLRDRLLDGLRSRIGDVRVNVLEGDDVHP